MIQGKKILLAVTGSIAAYKSVVLLRLLIKAGAEVKVVMTKSAAGFVAPLTFATLSKNKVLIDWFEDDTWANHIALGRWADLMLIAPASCNTIARMANGICDNLLLAVYLSAICPVLVVPAMDEDMWRHAATKKNIDKLHENSNLVLPVNNGELASGLSGEGRMAEPEEILEFVEKFFSEKSEFTGLKALVTAGPTHEAIDPVRFIGNHSSGKMGIAIAEELSSRGASVDLVLGPSALSVDKSIKTTKVVSATEMYEACMKDLETYDIIVMAAAVADYSPLIESKEKIKKLENGFSLQLIKTKDILAKAGELKTTNQTLVGFALETENEKENALTKLSKKNADLLVLNSLRDDGAGFGFDTNKITIFDSRGNEYAFGPKSKKQVAADIINTIIKYRNE
ncbi:MAG TPA: bifunctional phosphopantothenoylcysteine decarboxylase/phosphopantothenate--cysteine ligase CoaBC [Hanamia sp.]|nr:bifunctional phosphopantothenoylcysteine decarboxylase/phosphopantothenate--cysteine ligase CoaBC [Hanamia sp.]